jgi:enamine deaminase RidA (YjgF/YER057c/UK114 family)
MRQSWPAGHNVPISRAQRAGDFVLTSAYGPWTFDPLDVTFADDGTILDDGTGLRDMPFDEQVHRTFGFVKENLALADCTLDDVVESRCWLADPRDFVRFNEIYADYFTTSKPVRTVFPTAFMFPCRVEIQVVAYKPLGA